MLQWYPLKWAAYLLTICYLYLYVEISYQRDIDVSICHLPKLITIRKLLGLPIEKK